MVKHKKMAEFRLVIFGPKMFCKIHTVDMYVTGEFHSHPLTNTLKTWNNFQ